MGIERQTANESSRRSVRPSQALRTRPWVTTAAGNGPCSTMRTAAAKRSTATSARSAPRRLRAGCSRSIGELVGVADPLVDAQLLEPIDDVDGEQGGLGDDERGGLRLGFAAGVDGAQVPAARGLGEGAGLLDAAVGERPLDGGDVGLDGGRGVADEVEVSHGQTGLPVRNSSPRARTSPT